MRQMQKKNPRLAKPGKILRRPAKYRHWAHGPHIHDETKSQTNWKTGKKRQIFKSWVTKLVYYGEGGGTDGYSRFGHLGSDVGDSTSNVQIWTFGVFGRSGFGRSGLDIRGWMFGVQPQTGFLDVWGSTPYVKIWTLKFWNIIFGRYTFCKIKNCIFRDKRMDEQGNFLGVG